LNKAAASFASILGGIGFGTFIDELGKFITRDNDYFFQPSIALIYIIFVLIYLFLKIIPRIHTITQKEYLVNTVDMLKEAAINDFDIEEERRASEFINHCDPKDPFVREMARLLTQIKTLPTPTPSVFTRFRILLRNWYYTVAKQKFIIKIIIFYLAVQAVDTLFTLFYLYTGHPRLHFFDLGKIFSTSFAALFVVLGLFTLRLSRVEAYRFFRISVLISILLTQFFAFMSLQWLELIPLAINIFMLMVINYALYMEKQKSQGKILKTPLKQTLAV
jgi:hypothetical protein